MTARPPVWRTVTLTALLLLVNACSGDDSIDETTGTSTTAEEEGTSTSSADTTAADTTVVETTDAGPNTTDGAIARFEEFLHALGAGDVDVICEIAAPAARSAEEQGFGPCEQTYATVVDMISPQQADALRSATVDPSLVDTTTPGEVRIPVEAVVASVTFTEDDLGSYTLAYQGDNWFIVQ